MKTIHIIIMMTLSLPIWSQLDTTVYRLSFVDENKTTLLTETELRADGVEIAKKTRYDKTKALDRIREIDRELENITMMDEQYDQMIQQIRTELRKNRRKGRELLILKDRLNKIIDQL